MVANAQSFDTMLAFQFGTGRVYYTLGLFLLGLYAGRRRLFEQLAAKRGLFWRLGLGALLALVATKVGTMLLTHAHGPQAQAQAPAQVAFALVYDARNVFATFFYLAGLTLFSNTGPGAGPCRRWPWWAAWRSPTTCSRR